MKRQELKIVHLKTKNGIPENFMPLDTVITQRIVTAIGTEGTVFVNGLPGLWEHPDFGQGTENLLNGLMGIKYLHPDIRLFGGGGDFSIASYAILGEEVVKENFAGNFTMGGALLELLTSGELSALNFIDCKSTPQRIDGFILDYLKCLKKITDIPADFWKGKTVNLIVDTNVGDISGKIELSEMQKIIGIIDSLAYLLKMEVNKIRIFTHNGRYKDYILPKGVPSGTVDYRYSVRKLAPIIAALLQNKRIFGRDEKVEFIPDCLLEVASNSRVELYENTRFYKEESENNSEFILKLLGTHPADAAINDAAGALHRGKHCSKGAFVKGTKGPRVIGLLVIKELEMVSNIFLETHKPITVIFQGNKADKIPVIRSLIEKKIISKAIVMGGIANLFMDGDEETRLAMEAAEKSNIPLILPDEVVAAEIPKGMTKEKFVKALKANAI